MAVSRKTNAAPAGVVLDRLTSLANRWDSKKSAADDARGDLGSIAKEVEDLGFNRASFKLTMKLRNMEPDKRNDFLSSLNAYIDFFKIFAQGDLFGDAPTGVGTEASEPSAGAANLQGEHAGKRGDAIKNNPHPEGGAARAAWDAGWIKGQAEKVSKEIKKPKKGEDVGADSGRPDLSPDTETHASA